MNIATKIAAEQTVTDARLSRMLARQPVDQQTMRVMRDQYASISHGIDPREIRVDPADSNLPFAKSAAMLLSDEQRIDLIFHLLNVVDFDEPDLRQEVEGCLSDIRRCVRGEA